MPKLLVQETHTICRKDIVDLLVGRTVAEVEDELVLRTLRHCAGNRARAARMLGITPRTLRNKLARLKQAQELPPEGEAS